jgi:sortase (surface protein transpeptidase)
MRILMVPAIIASLIQPAYSQKPSINLWGDKAKDPAVEQYRKQQEEEYKATLGKIPNQEKKSNDPWQKLRSTEPAKKKSN